MLILDASKNTFFCLQKKTASRIFSSFTLEGGLSLLLSEDKKILEVLSRVRSLLSPLETLHVLLPPSCFPILKMKPYLTFVEDPKVLKTVNNLFLQKDLQIEFLGSALNACLEMLLRVKTQSPMILCYYSDEEIHLYHLKNSELRVMSSSCMIPLQLPPWQNHDFPGLLPFFSWKQYTYIPQLLAWVQSFTFIIEKFLHTLQEEPQTITLVLCANGFHTPRICEFIGSFLKMTVKPLSDFIPEMSQKEQHNFDFFSCFCHYYSLK